MAPKAAHRVSVNGADKEVPGAALLKAVANIPSSLVVIGDEIGKGNFKKVHRGRNKNRDVVLLRYTKDESNSNELKILAHLSKPNFFVPEVYGVCREKDVLIVVQEIAMRGTLVDILKNVDTQKQVSHIHKMFFALGVSRSMEFLQQNRVVHADLSCRNVLVHNFEESKPEASVVKVSDFGLSVLLPEGEDHATRRQPQPTRWCSPETIHQCKLSCQSDVWTFGTVLWEMWANGTAPWGKREKRADVASRLRDLAATGGASEGSADVSNDFPIQPGCPRMSHDALLLCLNVDESARPTISGMVEVLQANISDLEATLTSVEDRMLPPPDDAAAPGEVPKTVEPEVDLGIQEVSSRCFGELVEEGDLWHLEDDDGDDESPVKFKTLRLLMASPQAKETLGEKTMRALFHEMDAARAREMYLLDLVKKLERETRACSRPSCDSEKAKAGTPWLPVTCKEDQSTQEASCSEKTASLFGERSSGTSGDGQHQPNLSQSEVVGVEPTLNMCGSCAQGLKIGHEGGPGDGDACGKQALRAQQAQLRRFDDSSSDGDQARRIRERPRKKVAVPSVESSVSSDEESNEKHRKKGSRSRRRSRGRRRQSNNDTRTRAQPDPPREFWTVWTCMGQAMQRQDFDSEQHARAAFDKLLPYPCVLRDPSGAQAAARSWVSNYVRIKPVSAGMKGQQGPSTVNTPIMSATMSHATSPTMSPTMSSTVSPAVSPTVSPSASPGMSPCMTPMTPMNPNMPQMMPQTPTAPPARSTLGASACRAQLVLSVESQVQKESVPQNELRRLGLANA